MTALIVAAYLAAIVTSNLLAANYGTVVTPFTAFAFIGLDLVTRDYLHDRWETRGLWARMGALITAGSILAYSVNHVLPFNIPTEAVQAIALASAIAFAIAGVVDAVAYWALRDRQRLVRINGSNVPSALVDSLVFPALAFVVLASQPEPYTAVLVAAVGQFVAKVFGGFMWSLLLAPWWRRRSQ